MVPEVGNCGVCGHTLTVIVLCARCRGAQGGKARTRTKAIEKEIADLRDSTKELELKWKNEKDTLTEIKRAKSELEKARQEADNAEVAADLTKTAELRYGKIPHLEKEIETATKRLKKLQSTRRVLHEDITEEDIASVVSRWTGIPVDKMLEGEREKLLKMEEMLGKRVVALDLKHPAAIETVLRLVEGADALIEGFRPGVMERLGLGPEICLQRNPRLVYGRMTGWGQTGTLAHAAGHDINYLSLSGALHAIGEPGRKPVVPLNLVADGGGAMLLALGPIGAILAVLGAFFALRRPGAAVAGVRRAAGASRCLRRLQQFCRQRARCDFDPFEPALRGRAQPEQGIGLPQGLAESSHGLALGGIARAMLEAQQRFQRALETERQPGTIERELQAGMSMHMGGARFRAGGVQWQQQGDQEGQGPAAWCHRKCLRQESRGGRPVWRFRRPATAASQHRPVYGCMIAAR